MARMKKWSKKVQETSDALDLPHDIFTRSPEGIARGLKRAALSSKRRKAKPFQSAMSMLNYYINRAGRKLPKKDKARLEKAKNELRKAFGRKLK